MPTIAEVDNIHIYFYPNDHNPPHIHCYKRNCTTVIDIRTGIVIVGDMKAADLKIVKKWVATHKDELLSMWKR